MVLTPAWTHEEARRRGVGLEHCLAPAGRARSAEAALFARGRWTLSEDVVGCHSCGGYWCLVSRGGDAPSVFQCTGQPAQRSAARRVSTAKPEAPCPALPCPVRPVRAGLFSRPFLEQFEGRSEIERTVQDFPLTPSPHVPSTPPRRPSTSSTPEWHIGYN